MKTTKLWINSMIRRHDEVNDTLQALAEDAGITGKDYQHMCLLTEETLGMANQLLKDFDGEIWLETTADGYEILLEAEVRENRDAGADRDAEPVGFMSKVAEMLNCSYMFENAEEMPESLTEMLPDYMSFGIRKEKKAPVWAGSWCLSVYRQRLMEKRKEKSWADSDLDELEQSIVARLADEVTIGIRGHRVRMAISVRLRNR